MSNRMYLCKPNGLVLGEMSGLDENTVSLKQSISSPWELTFDVDRYVNKDGNIIESSLYQCISERMELLIDGEEPLRFVIDNEPSVSVSQYQEIKSVTAHGIECELQTKVLHNFAINTGAKESQENLLMGDAFRQKAEASTKQTLYNYNLNPYTQLPIDYITLCGSSSFDCPSVDDNKIRWNDKEYPFALNENGEFTIGQEVIVEIVKAFPRLTQDVYYGIDHTLPDGEHKSATYGTVIAVVDAILNLGADDNSGYHPRVCQPQYIFTTGKSNFTITTCSHEEKYNYAKRLKEGFETLCHFYDTFRKQLSLLDLAIEKSHASGWRVGNVPETFKNMKRSLSADNQDVYSFLTSTVANSAKVMFDFDRFNKRINVIDVSEQKYDTGVVISLRNLANSVNIQTSTEDGIQTKLKPRGANELGIAYVNFGDAYIMNLDYYMDKQGSDEDYQYVSKELHDKYHAWNDYRNNQKIPNVECPYVFFDRQTKSVLTEIRTYHNISRRQAYAEYSKAYNHNMKEIDDLTNLVPVDGTRVDYSTYSYEDLQKSYLAYQNAYHALIASYKADYNIAKFDADTIMALTTNGKIGTDIRKTIYGLDFLCYRDTIIPNIISALKMHCKTDAKGNLVTDDKGEFIYIPTGNPAYLKDADTAKGVNAYKYQPELYGLTELNVWKKAYVEQASILYKDVFVLKGEPLADLDGHSSVTYRDPNSWDSLTNDQQAQFLGEEDFKSKLNSYLDLVSSESRFNKTLTTQIYNGSKEVESKGIIWLFQEAIIECEKSLSSMQTVQTELQENRDKLANYCALENWKDFTDEDLSIINLLTKEAEYSNENILTTVTKNGLRSSDNDIEAQVEAQEELYQDASKKLYEVSQPQYTFSSDLDNLFALKEFEPMRDSVKLFNFIYLMIGFNSREATKLRISSITRNPIIKDTQLTLEFTNMTYSYNGLSDLASLFSDSIGSSSSGSSSGNSSGGSGYGANDLDVSLSNNLLNALLKNRDFSTYNGSIQMLKGNEFNIEDANKVYATYAKLADDSTAVVIDGSHLKTGKITAGRTNEGEPISTIDLDNGAISLGLGAFKYENGALTLKNGLINSDDKNSYIDLRNHKMQLGTNFWWNNQTLTLQGNVLISNSANNKQMFINTNNCQMTIMDNTTNNYLDFRDGKLKISGNIYAENGTFNGKITATSGTIGGFNIGATNLTTKKVGVSSGEWAFWAGMDDNNKCTFQVKQDGTIYSSNPNSRLEGLTIKDAKINYGQVNQANINNAKINTAKMKHIEIDYLYVSNLVVLDSLVFRDSEKYNDPDGLLSRKYKPVDNSKCAMIWLKQDGQNFSDGSDLCFGVGYNNHLYTQYQIGTASGKPWEQ